ncbi:MAG: prohibitin family protein [Elusimicrobia bacterium]|nr:prohibitin family protein [Elusimicrobiota bacterium]
MGYLLLAIIATGFMVMASRDKWLNGQKVDSEALASLIFRYGLTFFLLAIVAVVGTRGVVVVPPGHRGIIFNKISGIRQQALGEGFNLVIPLIEYVTLMDVRVQKEAYDASAASKDLQTIHTKVALNFHPGPESAPRIFQEVGLGYSERIIHPAVQEAVKATTARFTAEELIARREDVKKLIRELVEDQIKPFNVRVDELYITDFDFSRQFAEAIEFKQIAEQQALKAKRDLDRIRIEAEQKVATARAEAEALKMQKDAITAQLIQLRQVEMQKLAIEKWDGRMPSVMMGGTATPLLDLSTLTNSRPK